MGYTVKPNKVYNKVFEIVFFVFFAFCFLMVTTLAFFFESDWGSNNVPMSGAVLIEAVGKGPTYYSIEDTIDNNVATHKLVIECANNFEVLIPGMPIHVSANCKVFRSTSSPLLRASMTLVIYENNVEVNLGGAGNELINSIYQDMSAQLDGLATNSGEWYKYSGDNYFYYIGHNGVNDDPKLTLLQEVDVTSSNAVVPFLNDSTMIFPEEIESIHSGMQVFLTITFQAIQNFIPDDQGVQVANTIENSWKIFNTEDESTGV